MIIVEGPDGAGKTTLVKQISERFELAVGRRGVADRKLLYTVTVPDTFRALQEAVSGEEQPLVWDRLFFSEFVYYPLTNRKCEFNEAQRQHIMEVLCALRSPIILCLPPAKTVYANAGKAEQMDGVMDNLSRIYLAYVAVFKWMPAHAVVYDYTTEPSDRVMQVCEAYLARRSLREW